LFVPDGMLVAVHWVAAEMVVLTKAHVPAGCR
jgi:hypothetical protein